MIKVNTERTKKFVSEAELSALLAGGGIPGIATVPAEDENEEDSENEE